jgi:RNA polymerase subunit RPABC4/transcription elongation factor Spt4
MKKCVNCRTLMSNSSKKCMKCGSEKLEKVFKKNEPSKGVIYNKYIPKEEIRRCPTCGGAGVLTMKNGIEECSVCSFM